MEGDQYLIILCPKTVNLSVTKETKEWLSELISDEESAYRYRKLTVCLWRDHQLIINKKRVYRLLKEEELLQPQRKKISRNV
ncbi:IS3 family transposase [Brevibacillus formosus]